MIFVKCTYADGDTIKTGFNGTFEDAKKYFLNNIFNIGSGAKDNLQKCVEVEQLIEDEYGLEEMTTPTLFTELGKAYDESRPYSPGYLSQYGCGMQDYLGEKIDEAAQYMGAILKELRRRLINIVIVPNEYYDYENQAFVKDGKYVRCGHPENMNCKCYGRLHAGETAVYRIETIDKEAEAERAFFKSHPELNP